jgi:hypothetical protein
MALRKKTRDTEAPPPTAEISDRERSAFAAHLARRQSKGPIPRLKVKAAGGVTTIEPDHPSGKIAAALLSEALGTVNPDFATELINQLANAASKEGAVSEGGLNFMLAVVKDVEPRDQIEAMLAAQMAAAHMATMTFARRLNNVENIPQQDSAERAFNKLARTFAVQIEALKRYRSGGEQRVRVEHVTVNAGGQAIVGNVESLGGGAPRKSEDQPHAKQIAHAPGTPMPSSIEAEREAVPVAGGQG